MKVMVLGCGPAGLMAAHAASLLDHDVLILSKPRKSRMNGAQYLHRPIPMASSEPFEIDYRLVGSAEVYRDKVYGSRSPVQVSPKSLVGRAPAWDIREAYDWLWDTYGRFVQAVDFTETSPGQLLQRIDVSPDVVISTVPAQLLCEKPELHTFSWTKVWATDRAYELPGNDVVVCSGDLAHPWYRKSRIQGFENTEYPADRRPPLSKGVWEVVKPTVTTCDCLPSVRREGRYGRWTKGVLAHEAFYNTIEALQGSQETLF